MVLLAQLVLAAHNGPMHVLDLATNATKCMPYRKDQNIVQFLMFVPLSEGTGVSQQGPNSLIYECGDIKWVDL